MTRPAHPTLADLCTVLDALLEQAQAKAVLAAGRSGLIGYANPAAQGLASADGEATQLLVNGELPHLRGEPRALSMLTDHTTESNYLSQIERQYDLFSAVFAAIPDALFIADAHRRIVMANPASTRIFGHALETLAGLPLDRMFQEPKQLTRLAAAGLESADAHDDAQPPPRVVACLHADGSVFLGESVARVVRGAEGECIGLLMLVRDVSLREREQQAMADNRRRMQDLIDTMADWVWELDADGRYTLVSGRVHQILGYDPDWLIGKTPFDFMPADEARRMSAEFKTIAAKKRAFQVLENRCLRKDGSVRIMSSSGVPVLGDDGSLLGYRGIDRDVTAERLAAERIRDSEAQLKAIFDNANVGIMLLTGHRMLTRGNRRLAEILGYASPEEMVGISMRQLHLSETLSSAFGHHYHEQLRLREQLQVEYQLRRQDGTPVWCLLSGAALDDTRPADLNRGVIWSVQDISDIKRNEASLQALNARLSEEHELFASGPTMVFRWLPTNGWPVAYCSPNVERLLGISADDLIAGSRGFADCIHPDDLDRVADELKAHTRTGAEAFEQSYRMRDAGGQWRDFYGYIRVLKTPRGRVTGYHGYLLDVTEKRRREAKLRTLLDAIPDLIFFKDADGRYVECNQAFARFTGRSRDAVLGATDRQLFDDPDIGAFFREQDVEMLRTGKARRNDEWITYPDGTKALLNTLKMPYALGTGQALGVLGISRDITNQHVAELALRESEQRYRSIFDVAGRPMLLLSPAGLIRAINRAACRLLGYPDPGALLDVSVLALSPPIQSDGESSEAKGAGLLSRAMTGEGLCFEWDHQHLDGRPVPVEVTLNRVEVSSEPVLLTTLYDLSDRRRADELELRASTVFENTTEGIMITDADNRILSVNRAFTEITGYSEEEACGRRPGFLKSGRQDRDFYRAMWMQLNETGRWRGEVSNRRKDGELYVEWLSISLIHDAAGMVKNHIGIFSDITDARRSQEEIEHLTHYDLLTGLPNLVLLRAQLDQALRSAQATGLPLALLMLKLNGFKRIVSSYGHDVGDRLLTGVAQRLRAELPADATLARSTGDTFILVLELERASASPTRQAVELQQALREGIDAGAPGRISMGCSIGIVLYPADAENASELLRNAESALHRAKIAGPSSIAFYQPEMTEAATRRIELEQSLREALAGNEFELHFQPKFDLEQAAVVGAEALIRWRRGSGDLVPPGEFMPVVEHSDLVHDVGRWVLLEAARTVRHWADAGMPPMRVSVNVSSAMITLGGLADAIETITTSVGIKPSLLELEVLENVLLADPERAEAELRAIRGLGVTIAMDDFGTGYSSLGYLKRFPVDVLKIDQSFIAGLLPNSDDLAIVRSTISMAHHLGLLVVAEGVNDDRQVDLLTTLGCDLLQGYLIGKPVTAARFAALYGTSRGGALSTGLKRMSRRRLLLASADVSLQRRMSAVLDAEGWSVLRAADLSSALKLLDDEQVHLLLADVDLSDERANDAQGIALLIQARSRWPEIVRVLLAAQLEPGQAIDAVNRGGVFHILAPDCDGESLAELLQASFAFANTLRRAGPAPVSHMPFPRDPPRSGHSRGTRSR